jgi:hypothetical protein
MDAARARSAIRASSRRLTVDTRRSAGAHDAPKLPCTIDPRLEEEHAVFKSAVREIQAELDRAHDSRDIEGGRDTLLALLSRLRSLLLGHFSREEKGWSQLDASRSTPSTRRWIETLVREHHDYLKRIGELTSTLEAAHASREPLAAGFDGELSALLGDLLRHELSEARLMQRSVFEGMLGCE